MQASLKNCVEKELQHYLNVSKGTKYAGEIYDLIINEVEAILIRGTMQHCKGNQSEAARMLGIHRNTLYTKLQKYDLLDERK